MTPGKKLLTALSLLSCCLTVISCTSSNLDFAVSCDFNVWPDAIWPSTKPLNLRFTVVNLLDALYQFRSGTGIGEFAPQDGPRRGFYVTLSQKL
jgi:hypothetical protein